MLLPSLQSADIYETESGNVWGGNLLREMEAIEVKAWEWSYIPKLDISQCLNWSDFKPLSLSIARY